MVLVSLSVTEGSDADLVANATANEGSTSESEPLHGFELSATEMTGHAWAHDKNGSSTGTSESHRETKSAPATLGSEDTLLVEKVAVG